MTPFVMSKPILMSKPVLYKADFYKAGYELI